MSSKGTAKKTIVMKVGGKYEETGFLRNKSTGETLDIETYLFKAGTKGDIDDADQFKAFTVTVFQNADDNNNWWYKRTMSAADVLAHATAGIFSGVWDQWYSDDSGTTWIKHIRGSLIIEKKATDLS